MSSDVAARLRSLAQDHHDGRLDVAAYRALRAPLLDSLTSSAISTPAMEVTQPRTGLRGTVQPDAITRPGKPGAGTAASGVADGGATTQASSGKARVVVGCVVAVVVLLLVAVWFGRDWLSPAHGTATAAASGASGDAGVSGEGEANLVHDAVSEFVERGDWSDARLTQLISKLRGFGGGQLAAVARETGFERFVDELRRRLKEQQALATTTLTVENSSLAALAVTVGLDLNSPDAAIHIVAPPPPPAAERSAAEAAGPTTSAHSTGAPASQSHPTDTRRVAPDGHGAPEAAAASAGPSVTPSPGPGTGAAVAGDSKTAVSPPTVVDDACRRELVRSRRPLCQDSLSAGVNGPLMALIPAGAFDMGSTASSEEQPVHRVTIGEPFAVSVYEVSQGEFKQFCERTHRQCVTQPWSGDDYPVVNVSWDDARAYADWLTSVTRHRYGLPTEAQWEYAARAGNTGPFPSGSALSPTDSNFSTTTRKTAAAPRSEKFNANPFRLMHTVGNVREWVQDSWAQNFSGAPNDGSAIESGSSTRVVRGGSYADGSARLRLSMREGLASGTRDVTTGFRLVRDLP